MRLWFRDPARIRHSLGFKHAVPGIANYIAQHFEHTASSREDDGLIRREILFQKTTPHEGRKALAKLKVPSHRVVAEHARGHLIPSKLRDQGFVV